MMPRIETIIEKYSPLLGYEWEVYHNRKCTVVVPLFRRSTDPADAVKVELWPCGMDQRTAEFLHNNEVLTFEQLLARLPPLIKKIVVMKDAEPIKTFYHVKNVFSNEPIK